MDCCVAVFYFGMIAALPFAVWTVSLSSFCTLFCLLFCALVPLKLCGSCARVSLWSFLDMFVLFLLQSRPGLLGKPASLAAPLMPLIRFVEIFLSLAPRHLPLLSHVPQP